MNSCIDSRITPLDRLTADGGTHAGAKAANCARLKQAGFRVPDGLVVSALATRAEVASLADHAWFDQFPADARFAVRSSGIGEDGEGQSFAGIHETALDVRRGDIPSAVAACRASGRSAQALEYRRATQVTDEIAMGVLVQRMVDPIAAGVAFTRNPVTGADGELVINSSWGLGEALVSGQVDPDEFVMRKRDAHLLWSRIGEKGTPGPSSPSLTAAQLAELARILVDIERHFGSPQDVEWCHDGLVFWIVQSRPITTADAAADATEWTRANLAEVMPDLTSPQALAAFGEVLNRAERMHLGRVLAPDAQVGPVVKAFGGRLYFNLSQLRRACAMGGTPPAVMLRSMGHAEAIQPRDEVSAPWTIDRLSCAPDIARILWRHLRVERAVRRHHAETRAYIDRFTSVDPNQLSAADLWRGIEQWFEEAPAYMQLVLLLGNVMFHEIPVRNACAKVGVPFEELVYPQLASGERSVSARQAFDLVSLAAVARSEPRVVSYLTSGEPHLDEIRAVLEGTAFLDEFERYLATYGHRGLYEYDWALPRYREDPAPILRALRAHLADNAEIAPADADARRESDAARALAAFGQRLWRWQRWTILPAVKRSIRRIKQYYVWREQVRSDVARVLGAVREWHLALAQRLVERRWLNTRDEYFLLEFREIAAMIDGRTDRDACRAIVAGRIAERERHRSLQMPLFMRESELPALIRTAAVSGGVAGEGDLNGHPVSGGCVEAEVVVVHDPGDFNRMKRGAILVAPATDPSWTPLFTLASGVIVEIGGVLSHASTIAREYGLPALANVKHATRRLRTGDRVRLDATRGLIQRLPQAAPIEA